MFLFSVQGFTATLHVPPELTGKLNVQAKPVEPVVERGAQIQQLVNAECVEDYVDSPSMNIAFTCNGAPHRLMVKLPLSLNKFFEPTEMNGDSFFARWKNLGKYVIICFFVFCRNCIVSFLFTVALNSGLRKYSNQSALWIWQLSEPNCKALGCRFWTGSTRIRTISFWLVLFIRVQRRLAVCWGWSRIKPPR